MSFLGALTDAVSSQLSLGENETHTLDAVVDGQQTKYGSLGDFASKFDQSEDRKYVEEGYLRRDPYNTDPKAYQILLQEPNATVLVKKKMFSSVGENFRPDFMNADEKVYYKAMKILFQNKCRQIAALEKLSKIQQVTAAVGQFDTQLMPLVLSLGDVYASGLNTGSNFFGLDTSIKGATLSGDQSSFVAVLQKLRKVYAYNQASQYTNWVTDPTALFNSQFAQGTGVIEITNFTSVNTSVSNNLDNPGNFGLTISDPYESMVITEWDIEKALSDATNSFYNHKSFQFGLQGSQDVVANLTQQLNQAREARKASPISFTVDPNTLLGKRVTAVLDRIGTELVFKYDSTGGTGFPGLGGAGNSVSVGPEYLQGGAVAGFDGLSQSPTPTGPDNNIRRAFASGSELSLFQQLVAAIYNQIQMQANSTNATQSFNANTNYARRKLRFNFSGKLIIQPMDTIHVYMNSKSRWDNRISAGLQNMFTGAGILQNINNTVTNFTNTFNSLFSPSNSVPLQVEKAIYVGPQFPNFLWNLVRTQFVTEREGTHVFAGVVETATDNWSDGKFTVSVGGKDNSLYFEQGKINFKPGVDVYNGSAFDPLTPFKTNFDTVTSNTNTDTQELLDENKNILGTSKKDSIVKAKLGPYAGAKITQSNYIQDRSFDPSTGQITKVFFAPDGLVYQWKEGIGVFTQFGDAQSQNDPNRIGNPNIFNDPFAGQDVMNVISLLITGVPYNFTTFYKAVVNDGNYGRDPQTQQDPSYAFINSVNSQISKNNTLWGNFIPFKNLVVDEATYAAAQRQQFRTAQLNADLDKKLKQYRDLNQQTTLFDSLNDYAKNTGNATPPFQNLRADLNNIKGEIDTIISNISLETSSFSSSIGNDPSFDYSSFIDSNTKGAGSEGSNYRKYLRRQINSLTRRMSYDVRANEDKNFFIVDDFYDKDYDIMAYDQALTDGIKLYNNEYTSVKEKISLTANLLNLEVFCDTQGHIRVRSPQYNRMPSSVFYRMMYLKQALNIQIFPDYLNNLFNDQITTLKQQIEIVEDEIRLDCAILGYQDDDSASGFLQQQASQNTSSTFQFLSDSSGEITDMTQLTFEVTQDITATNQGLASDSTVGNQASIKNLFTNTQRYAAIQSALKTQESGQQGIPIVSSTALEQSSYVDTLIKRIFTKSGQRLSTKDYIATNAVDISNVALPPNQTVDVFKVTGELADRIAQRQRVVKLFYSTLKNSIEFKSLDDNGNQFANQMLTPGNFGNSHIPQVLENMIEDESLDDYGPGSGQRYVIKRGQIRHISIAENAPEWTSVQVQGILNPFAPNALPEGLNSFPGSGNGLVTALAVDYDMWRQYGFKQQASVKVPFLSDPQSQCGPYASMLLSRNRKNILRGTITISGNEFMQPGEVVFLEDRGLLFYVTAVKHSFGFAQSFTTSLDLSYGHTPGEYIPTVMDFIGKLIYKNKDTGSMIIQRQDSSTGDISMGAVLKDTRVGNDSALNTGNASQNQNQFSASNGKTINNIMFQCAYMVNANNSVGNNVQGVVEIRYYNDDSTNADGAVIELAQNIQSILTGGTQSPQISTPQNNQPPPLPSQFVKLVPVNIDSTTDYRSPSQKALDAARNLANTNSSGSSPATGDVIRQKLFQNVVDVWVTFAPVNANNQTSGS